MELHDIIVRMASILINYIKLYILKCKILGELMLLIVMDELKGLKAKSKISKSINLKSNIQNPIQYELIRIVISSIRKSKFSYAIQTVQTPTPRQVLSIHSSTYPICEISPITLPPKQVLGKRREQLFNNIEASKCVSNSNPNNKNISKDANSRRTIPILHNCVLEIKVI